MKIKSVPVKVAAAILGKNENLIRCKLAYGKLPFSVAVTSNKKSYFVYNISAEKFKDYAGCTDEKTIECAKKLGCDLQIDED